ncbi:MAG: hypothetical protein B6I31_03640 [Desulfobacteraceae bacterium 4572_19]|nr:MAG: hypothetical protein B6I31_03640 [Desulfobacteraceae bacterium 4572_19]
MQTTVQLKKTKSKKIRPDNIRPKKIRPTKIRLDMLLIDKNIVKTRQHAQAVIMAGKVLVDDMPVDKAGKLICTDAKISVHQPDMPYVSRGALKIEEAIKKNNINVKGFVCLDAGASTGGFTDYLLQHGAKKVYAVDVGYGQLAWKLRQDPRVIVIERTNIRYMDFETIGEKVDLISIDTSFISLKIVIPAILKFMKDNSSILALIKPQFEVGKGKVGKFLMCIYKPSYK